MRKIYKVCECVCDRIFFSLFNMHNFLSNVRVVNSYNAIEIWCVCVCVYGNGFINESIENMCECVCCNVCSPKHTSWRELFLLAYVYEKIIQIACDA